MIPNYYMQEHMAICTNLMLIMILNKPIMIVFMNSSSIICIA